MLLCFVVVSATPNQVVVCQCVNHKFVGEDQSMGAFVLLPEWCLPPPYSAVDADVDSRSYAFGLALSAPLHHATWPLFPFRDSNHSDLGAIDMAVDNPDHYQQQAAATYALAPQHVVASRERAEAASAAVFRARDDMLAQRAADAAAADPTRLTPMSADGNPRFDFAAKDGDDGDESGALDLAALASDHSGFVEGAYPP